LKLFRLSGKATNAHVVLMIKALRWPRHMVFPFLDIARLALLNKSFQQVLMASENNALEFLDIIIPHITDTDVEVNQNLTLKVINNIFACPSGDKVLIYFFVFF
jgi:hypothetical protein